MMNDDYKKANPNRHEGFGINFYRNVHAKKIAGVCAGIADHFAINHNIMRIIFIAGFLLTGTLIIWLYALGWIIMAPKPKEHINDAYEYDETERCYRKKNMFRYRRSATERIKEANQRLKNVGTRVGDIERYVTSKRFDLDAQFADLES